MTQPARALAPAEPQPEVPPHDNDAERAVLSAAILDKSALPKVIDFLRTDHFFSGAHLRIFEAALELYREKAPVDVQTIASRLHARGRFAEVGGFPYLGDILDASPAVAHVRSHAVAVHDMWRRRQVIKLCQRVIGEGYVSVGNVQDWCDAAVRELAKLAAQSPVHTVETNDQALARLLSEVFNAHAEGSASGSVVDGFPTGIYGIDRILGGIHKGAKTTVAATTGAGKTSFAGQFALRTAKRGVGVLFFSTELKREELLMRMVCAESGVSMERVKARRLTQANREAMAAAAASIRKLPIVIDETARINIDEVSAASKATKERMEILDRVPMGVIVLDYIQRLEPPRHMVNRDPHEQISYSTKQFKMLCQELDVSGLELAQAKPLERGKQTRPNASNGIADSSKISKEADNVVFLVADGEPAHDDPRQEVTAIVAKQRNGRKGDVRLMFRGDLYTFIDPNAPDERATPSRQYVDPIPEPPRGRFDDDDRPIFNMEGM